MKKVWNIFSYIIILFLILIIGWTFINKGRPPSIFGYKFLSVLSESMEPDIKKGSLVVVKNTDINELVVGDVITYSLNNTNATVTHRIVAINREDDEKVIVTKGDANNCKDNKKITKEMIVGKVTYHIGVVGELFIFIKQYAIVLLLLTILLTIILPEIKKHHIAK